MNDAKGSWFDKLRARCRAAVNGGTLPNSSWRLCGFPFAASIVCAIVLAHAVCAEMPSPAPVTPTSESETPTPESETPTPVSEPPSSETGSCPRRPPTTTLVSTPATTALECERGVAVLQGSTCAEIIDLSRVSSGCTVVIDCPDAIVDGQGAHLRELRIFASRDIRLSAATLDLIHIGADAPPDGYPHTCRSTPVTDSPPPELRVGHLSLRDAHVRAVRVYWATVASVDAGELHAESISLSASRITGCVNFQDVETRTLQADRVDFGGGVRMFGAHVSGSADFARATFSHVADFMLTRVDGVLQLANAHFVSPDERPDTEPCPRDSAVPERGVCRGTDGLAWNFVRARLDAVLAVGAEVADGSSLIFDGAHVAAGLDLRGATATVRVASAHVGELSLSVPEPVTESSGSTAGTTEATAPTLALTVSTASAASIGSVAIGPECGGSSRVATAAEVSDLLGSSGVDRQSLASIAQAADQIDDARRLQLEALWANATGVERVLLAIAGAGLRPMWWYFLLAGCVYFVALGFFSRPPSSVQSTWHPLLFSLAVLLPSAIDIGVSTKDAQEQFPWHADGKNRALLTRAFHLLHIAGWIVLSIVLYALGKRFS